MSGQPQAPRNIQRRTFEFVCRIIRLHQYFFHQQATGYELARQLLRSGTAIGANLEEADAGQSKADFIAKCSIALKEARETHYWLRLLCETELIVGDRISPLINEADEIIAILTTIIKKSRQS